MEPSNDQFKRIEKYCREEMSASEKDIFEREIKSDPQLAAEVDSYMQTVLAVRMNAFRSSLSEIHEQVIPVRKINSQRWLMVAASIVVLLGSGWYFFVRESKSDALFAEYVTVDPGLPVPMSAASNFAFHDAMVDYKNEQYKKAITKWTQLLNDEPQNDTLIYYLGVSHFNATAYDRAISCFDQLSAMSESAWHDKARWYMALSLLKTDQFEKLHELATDCEGPYCDKLKAISNEIK